MTKEELDRLVKMLENADLDPWDDDRAIEDVLNLIRAWPVEEPASPWISVKDRLPEDFVNVLIVFIEQGRGPNRVPSLVVKVASHVHFEPEIHGCGSSWNDDLDSDIQEWEVTHWQPLPAPPETPPTPVPPGPRTGPA